jgi:hypothetical protein
MCSMCSIATLAGLAGSCRPKGISAHAADPASQCRPGKASAGQEGAAECSVRHPDARGRASSCRLEVLACVQACTASTC